MQTVRVLGQGSFGKVELVKELSTDELFALKKIKLGSERHREFALREGRALFDLRHENLVAAFSYFEKHNWFHNNKFGILLEYCDGGDLHALVKTSKDIPASELERNLFAIILQVRGLSSIL